MAAYQKPLPSATGGLAFSRLPSDEIKKISVKQIHVTPALDSMFGPIPGGVHDLALGAISALDAKYVRRLLVAAVYANRAQLLNMSYERNPLCRSLWPYRFTGSLLSSSVHGHGFTSPPSEMRLLSSI
jgi:hypothetical protein